MGGGSSAVPYTIEGSTLIAKIVSFLKEAVYQDIFIFRKLIEYRYLVMTFLFSWFLISFACILNQIFTLQKFKINYSAKKSLTYRNHTV